MFHIYTRFYNTGCQCIHNQSAYMLMEMSVQTLYEFVWPLI